MVVVVVVAVISGRGDGYSRGCGGSGGVSQQANEHLLIRFSRRTRRWVCRFLYCSCLCQSTGLVRLVMVVTSSCVEVITGVVDGWYLFFLFSVSCVEVAGGVCAAFFSFFPSNSCMEVKG